MHRGVLSNATRDELLTHGLQVLDDLQVNATKSSVFERGGADLQLHTVALQGFGPFREPVTYPLLDRGLVLIRGSNEDGGADRCVANGGLHRRNKFLVISLTFSLDVAFTRSNGSGKTSLAMSVLWAFTGSVDARPLPDARVSDVVNDSSKVPCRRQTLSGLPKPMYI